MAKKLTSVLGVDIGSQRIKVAELKTQGREPVITTLGMIATPEGAVDHTGVFNSDAVGTALKQLISQCGVSTSDVVVSIAGQASVLVRTLEVPRMNPAELTEHMQWEINRNIPFAESTVVSDFKPLGDDDPNSPNMDVVMAISPQSAIDTIIACVKKSGKKVSAIDVEPLGIARSLQTSYSDQTSGETICVVDLGHKTTSINIYKDGKILMPRQVPIGGESFTRAIADGLMVSVTEAERIKQETAEIPEEAARPTVAQNPFAPADDGGFQPYNPFADNPVAEPTMSVPVPEPDYSVAPPGYDDVPVPPATSSPADPNPYEPPHSEPEPVASTSPVPQQNPEAMRVFNSFSAVLEEFTAEIRRSVDYFRSRGGDINRVLLCGGGAHLKGLPAYLTTVLSLPCDGYDPTRRLNLSMKKVAPGFVDDHRQEFAVAIGNGLQIFFD